MANDFDVDSVLAKLSLSDKIKLVSGSAWCYTAPIPGHEDKRIKICDGPNGVRGEFFFNSTPSSCFPCATGLGSSFDVELAHTVGEALGRESKAKGAHVLLGPTINTQRSPLGGRGFESFAEDPYLNGTIAAAYIRGLQSKGVSATAKHFVANDQETERMFVSSEVSERALREIYLKPFQIAVKHANPWAMMTSYGSVNGIHASEDKRLLHDILRKEWGYKGLLSSDWGGTYSTSKSIKAGLDLEMPGPSIMRGSALQRALSADKVSESELDTCVRKVLELMKRGLESGVPFNIKEGIIDDAEERLILRKAAQDAIVLLKNEPVRGKKLLPLSRRVGSIAVIGPNADIALVSGGGSARLALTYAISPLDGIEKAVNDCRTQVKFTIGAVMDNSLPLLDPFIAVDGDRGQKPGGLFEFWNSAPLEDFLSTQPLPEPSHPIWATTSRTTDNYMMDHIDKKVDYACWIRWSTTFTPTQSGDWDFSLMIIGRAVFLINDKLVIDLTNPVPGDGFFGEGSQVVRGIYEDMRAGQSYKLEVRLENVERGPSLRVYGGIRLGGACKLNADAEREKAVCLAKESDAVVLVVGLNNDLESEGYDRTDLDLPASVNKLIHNILDECPEKTVVVNQSGMPVAMPWVHKANALVQAFYGGNELGNALADVLFGDVNPSGKLPITYPRRVEDTPPFPSYGTQIEEYGKVLYNEGIFVGYRSYDIRKVAPLFEFGFGLSYTTFEYSDLSVSEISEEGKFHVKFTITNTGHVHGREIAQVYISDEKASLPRPVKELKAFKKVSLEAGGCTTVKLHLDRDALGFYDDRAKHWIAEKGKFTVHVAASSACNKGALKANVTFKRNLTWTGL